jgi:hypothetical protein
MFYNFEKITIDKAKITARNSIHVVQRINKFKRKHK